MRKPVVSPVRDDRVTAVEPRDLEAETARLINMLVARTKAWRNGSMQGVVKPEAPKVVAS